MISKETARDYLVNYQGLNDPEGCAGYEGAKEYMQRVRCIQYDPLNVVGRNPDLVLQARVKDYKPQILEDLLYRDRVLMDGEDKVLSIFMAEDYPKMARVRSSKLEELKATLAYRDSMDALLILDDVLAYIRDNGPQPSGSITIGGRADSGRWGHRNLASAALDYLFHSGQLGIRTKKNVQRIYDLNRNLFPKELLEAEDPFATDREFLKWYLKKRIGAIGMAWNKNTGAWLGQYIGNRKLRAEILAELAEEGEILALEVEGSKEKFYIRREDEELLGKPAANPVAQFLAPLDNLIWDRGMVEELFHFSYSWEVYTPASKRKYGYYVLPVLYKNRFVARFEPEPNDGTEPLCIKNWWWEPDVVVTDEMLAAIEEAFRRFSAFLGVGMMKKTYWKKLLKV